MCFVVGGTLDAVDDGYQNKNKPLGTPFEQAVDRGVCLFTFQTVRTDDCNSRRRRLGSMWKVLS